MAASSAANHSNRVQAQPRRRVSQGNPRCAATSPTANAQPDHGQNDAADAKRRRSLQSASQHVEQYPHRRDVLQHDCRRDRRLLDSEIVEVVGSGEAENSQQKKLRQMAAAHPQRRLAS